MNDLLRRISSRPYTLVCLIALSAMGLAAVAKHTSEWNETYVRAAERLIHGGDMYRDFLGYVYPPFSAFVSVPFVTLPPRLARGIWYVICAACLVFVARASWRIAGGPPLESNAGPSRASAPDHIAFLLAQACVLQLALNSLTHLQPDLLIAALLMAGCQSLLQRKYLASATWIGLSAAFKVTPLLFVPYLAWRKQFVAAAWVVVLAVAVNLLPDLIHRPRQGGTWLGEWSSLVLTPMARPNYVPGDWANKVNNNQALGGAVNRWLGTGWRMDRGEMIVFKRPGVSSSLLRGTFAALAIVIVLPVGLAMWRRRRDGDREIDPAPSAAGPTVAAVECAIILLLMLLFSPNSSRSHFCILYLPAFCLARVAVRPHTGFAKTMLLLALLASTLSIHIRIGSTAFAEQIMLWIGVVMFVAMFLLAGCVAMLASQKKLESSP